MLKETLLKATHEAGTIMKNQFHQNYEVYSKGSINDLVTEIDKRSEDAILKVIREQYPGHQILSEEAGEFQQDSDYKWIIDPIDGTVNYAHGLPICCVSIAVEKEGMVEMGAVYNPFMDEFYFAERDAGATLNEHKISVSQNEQIESAFLVTGFPYVWEDASSMDPIEVFERLVRRGLPVRRLGSAALDLCWVASGRFDGFWEHHLNAWDSAAGFLIVEEAGGKVTDYKGDPYSPYQKQLLATNGLIHEEMLKEINFK